MREWYIYSYKDKHIKIEKVCGGDIIDALKESKIPMYEIYKISKNMQIIDNDEYNEDKPI